MRRFLESLRPPRTPDEAREQEERTIALLGLQAAVKVAIARGIDHETIEEIVETALTGGNNGR